LKVYNSTGTTLIGGNDDGRDFDSFTLNDSTATATSFDASLYMDLSAGTYYVRVASFNSASTGNYQLKLTADSSYTSTPPVFNSNFGADDTFYLDFDGHSATGD